MNNETILELSGLTENFQKGMDLFIRYFRPIWQNENINKTINTILKQRKIGFENKDTIRTAMIYYSRNGEDSPFFQCLSTSELKKTKKEDLQKSLKHLLNTDDLMIEYTGRDSIKKVMNESKKIISKIFSIKNQIKTHYRSKNRWIQNKKYTQPEIHFLNKKGLSQSSISIGFAESEKHSKEQAIYNLFNEYFDGSMGSIVFEEIRSLRALAYSVFAFFFYPERQEEKVIFYSRMGTQVDKSMEATEVMTDLIKNPPIIKEKFKIAKKSLISKYITGRVLEKDLLKTIRNWQEKGFTNQDPRKLFLEQTKKITIEDFEKFIEYKVKNKI